MKELTGYVSRHNDRSGMGLQHHHSSHSGGAQSRPTARFAGRLAISFGLTAGFFLVEIIAGLISGSLALIADASHMATDVVALGASLLATRIARVPDGTGRRTYGRYRAEVFAAGLACLLMGLAGVVVLIQAARRIGTHPDVTFGWMLAVGLLGLIVNIAAVMLLRRGSKESLNIRGAYLEVLGDAASSGGVVVAAVLVAISGSPVWDLVVAALIGLFVLVRAFGLGRSVLRVLGQHSPEGIDVSAVAADLGGIEGVSDVHDLHIWALTSGMNVASAHLRVVDEVNGHSVLDQAHELLAHRYQIDHATVQVEPADHLHCHEVSW
jgi:cobalt-zinc-cadmium efflux system protein